MEREMRIAGREREVMRFRQPFLYRPLLRPEDGLINYTTGAAAYNANRPSDYKWPKTRKQDTAAWAYSPANDDNRQTDVCDDPRGHRKRCNARSFDYQPPQQRCADHGFGFATILRSADDAHADSAVKCGGGVKIKNFPSLSETFCVALSVKPALSWLTDVCRRPLCFACSCPVLTRRL